MVAAPQPSGRWEGRSPAGRARAGRAVPGAVVAMLVMALFVTPPDAEQGQVFRLIYLHVPSAWLAYPAFTVVLVASIAYLRTKKTRWDRLGAASAEVGVVFTALTLILGSIWAKPVWGTWWTWDPRLTTTAVLLLIYLGYLAVRRLSDDPRRRAPGRRWSGSSVSSMCRSCTCRWSGGGRCIRARRWRESLPAWPPIMGWTLLLSLVAFTILFAYMVVLRLRVGRLEDRAVAEALSPRIGVRAAAAAAGVDLAEGTNAASDAVEGVAAGG